MDAQADIGQRIEKIREIFQKNYSIAADQGDSDLLAIQLE